MGDGGLKTPKKETIEAKEMRFKKLMLCPFCMMSHEITEVTEREDVFDIFMYCPELQAIVRAVFEFADRWGGAN